VHIATQVYGLMQKSVMCYLQTVLRLWQVFECNCYSHLTDDINFLNSSL
jgi:hypothetical protein